jgi:glycosyltransferase involved in cell wall biosynthesis
MLANALFARTDGPSRGLRPFRENASASRGPRLMVVSHPAVVTVNQETYLELSKRGWEVSIVVPDRWRSEFSDRMFTPLPLAGLEHSLMPRRVLFPGRPQRHLYLTHARQMIERIDPDVVFIEAEPFSFAATQWSIAAGRAGVPFGVQCAENIDRELPAPVRRLRARVLARAAFVAARSETAIGLVRSWGARGEVLFAPHAVPGWETTAASAPRPFTVGYAGRLVESKGLLDLLAAVRELEAPVELLLIGNGELRGELEGKAIPGGSVSVRDGLNHEQMAAGYAAMDVLALPSHTTPTWKEQFGRVIVEALWCGVPVVGSDSGEIPWLIGLTGGGLVFAEGDHAMLAAHLRRLREDPALRTQLAETGRASVERLFTVAAATDPLERMLRQAADRGASSRR